MTRANAGWLGEGEQAQRNLIYTEAPEWLRRRFWSEVAKRRKALGEAKAREEAWRAFMRIRAWARRGADAKPCERCGTSVLWRREAGRHVPTTPEGWVHACGDDEGKP